MHSGLTGPTYIQANSLNMTQDEFKSVVQFFLIQTVQFIQSSNPMQ